MARRRDLLSAASALTARLTLPTVLLSAEPAPATEALPLGPVGVVGTRYHAAARVAHTLRAGDLLELRRDLLNRHDSWAVAVHTLAGDRLGYLPRGENRHVAELLDAGARIGADMMEGHPFEAGPGHWRLAVRLWLHGLAPAPAPDEMQREGLADLRRAAPLMAERRTGPDCGARAVMLAGPCAGWQRTKGAEWVPPGSVPWPAAELIVDEYKLAAGNLARDETARALREAKARGLSPPGAPPLGLRPATAVDRPPERPRLLLQGWLDTCAHGDAVPAGRFSSLDFLKLRRAPPSRYGAPWMEVHDRDDRLLGRLRRDTGGMAARLMDEGYELDIVPRPPGPQPRPGGGLRVPFDLRLRGDDPPDVARRRAEYLRHIANLLPPGWDAERAFGQSPGSVLSRFLAAASPAAHRNGGRLDEETAARLKAQAGADEQVRQVDAGAR